MVCLETDFLVDLVRKKKEAISKLVELTRKNVNLTVTPISLTELFMGAFKSKKDEKVFKIEQMVSSLDLLDFDFFASKEAGKLLDFLEKKGKKIGDMDALTAAIVIRHEEKLLTRNVKHFKEINELKLEKY